MKPEELKYNSSHEWVGLMEENGQQVAVVGITDFALEQLTDLVFMALPEVGTTIKAGEEFGEVESVKAVSPLYSPVDGEVLEVHSELVDKLETLPDDPYGEGWFIKVKLAEGSSLEGLMDYEGYRKQCTSLECCRLEHDGLHSRQVVSEGEIARSIPSVWTPMKGFSVVDIPRSGAENMALDEQMLRIATNGDAVLLRVYQWSQPTLSLGYFQRAAHRQQHAESLGTDMVRRLTGGGAILHHHEWTYSLAVPNSMLGSVVGASRSLYDCVHESVVKWLAGLGLSARQHTASCPPESGSCRFLCFERRSPGDVMLGDWKIMGSAQRRSKGALLQHGSLLLRRSEFAPSLSGVADLEKSNRAASIVQAVTVERQSDDDEQVCHREALRLQDFYLRLSASTMSFLGIPLEPQESVGSIGLNPSDLGRFSDANWTHRT